MSRFHRSGRVEGLGGAKAPRRKRRPLHLEGLEDRRLLTAIALPDSYFLAQNGTLDVPAAGVLANDIAASENVLTVVSSTDPAHGTATVNPDGSFTYAPDLDYVGDDSFDYTITDIDANTATTTVTLTIDPANTPPVAADDAYATDEDTLLTVPAPGLLANDTGAEGATLTVSLVTGPTLGTLVLTPDGSFTYMPNANAFGTDSFTYQAGDGTSLSNAATVTLTINPVNDAPTAADDAYAIYPNGTLTIDAPGVLGNDTDVEGDPLTVAVVSDPGNGTLTLNPDGSFLYTPIIGFVGTDSFTYVANDGAADSNVATVTIKVNTPPTAADDAYATDEDTPLLIVAPGVLGNDDDPNGQPLTATVVTGPTNGTLALNPDGSFLYTPNLDYFGPDSFTYQADDGIDPSNAATVTITVNPVNDAPSAGDDTYTLLPGTTLTVDAPGVLENDTDVEGDPLTAVVVAEPTNGTLTLNPDGSFTYTPNVGFAGTDSFTYTANDGAADSNVATVTLIVNTLPLAVDDDYATDEDTPLVIAAPGVLGNDTDADGQPLTATVVAGPTNGTLALNPDGSFTYTPTANYSGPDSFTYQAGDGTDLSNVATVTITVNPVNDAPTAVDDSYTLLSNTTLTINAPGVLGNDTDPEGDPLTAVVATNPMNGTLTLNPDGSFTYTPNAGFFGSDSFTYQANDGAADSNAATVTLLVSAPPVAVDDSYSVDEDGSLQIATPGVLGNDSDPEGGTLTAVIVSNPTSGVLTLNPNGSFSYVPNANFSGTDSFTYQASDGTNLSNVATVTITVNPANDAPVAVDDTYATTQNTALTIAAPGVLGNDTDADGNPLTATLVANPTHGALTFNADGSFTYAPTTGYSGLDSFTYTASDGTLTSNVATVTLTIVARNTPPVANNDTYAAFLGTTLNVPAPGVLGNDTDIDRNPLIAILVTSPAHGTLTLNADGSFAYAPTAGYTGPDSFTYKASDGLADSNVATVSLTVSAVNTPPVISGPLTVTVAAGSSVGLPAPGVLANATDADGNPLTAILVTGPSNGTLVLNPNGSFVYTPNAGFVGVDNFTFQAADAVSQSNVGTVVLNVGATSAASGPRVLSVARYGVRLQRTSLVIQFSEALDPQTVQFVANYRVTTLRGGRIAVRSVDYLAATNQVVVTLLRRLSLRKTYRLAINAGPGGLRSTSGLALDGAGTGQPGTSFVTLVNRSNFAGPARAVPGNVGTFGVKARRSSRG